MSSKPGSVRISLVSLITLALVACGGTTQVIDRVDAATAQTLIGRSATVLLDIRTPEEFAETRIAGSVNINFYAPDFADQIGELDRNAAYVVYCRSGNRSAQAMDVFRQLDFAEVHEIDGGIVAWVGAGLPVIGG